MGKEDKPTNREVTDVSAARVPVVVSGCDIRSLPLSQTDAYVWSRIDGSMSENELVLVTGLDAGLVSTSLTLLAQLGAIRFDGAPRRTTSHVAPRAAALDTSSAPHVARVSESAPSEPRQKPSGLYPKQPASMSASLRHSTLPPQAGDRLNRYLEAARAATVAGNPTAAANFYRLAIQLAPNEPSIKDALDECTAASAEARTASERVESILRVGDTLAREQLWEGALGYYERALEHAPSNSHALYKAGGALYKLGDRLREAEDYVNRSLAADPKRIEAWLLLAQIQLGSGATKAAQAAVQQAQKLAPTDPRVVRFVAKLAAG